ncbi:MAG: hypothetical protein JOZ15_14830 [Acidobacteria bacterium]|nr:hypothetical protein [Acidobacteriota bacterium]
MAGNQRCRPNRLTITLTAAELARFAAAAEALAMTRAAGVRHQAVRAAPEASGLPARFQDVPLPRASARFTHTVSIWLPEAHFEALDEQARACGSSLSSLFRHVLAGRSPGVRHPIARSAIVAVNRAGNDLRQLLQRADSGTLIAPDLLLVVAELRREIQALRDALLTADAAASPETPA